MRPFSYRLKPPAALLSLVIGAVLLTGCASSVSGDAGTQSHQQAPIPPSSQNATTADQPTSSQQSTEPQTTDEPTTAAVSSGGQTTTPPASPPTLPSTPPATRSVVRTTVIHTATVTAEQPTQGGAAGGATLSLDHFSSPSGNISCLIATDSQPEVRCDLADSTIPKDHDCNGTGDWGLSVTLVAGAKVEMRCISDTVMQPGIPALAYGQKTKVGVITCTSAEDGMHCADTSGHGFRLAKASYDAN